MLQLYLMCRHKACIRYSYSHAELSCNLLVDAHRVARLGVLADAVIHSLGDEGLKVRIKLVPHVRPLFLSLLVHLRLLLLLLLSCIPAVACRRLLLMLVVARCHLLFYWQFGQVPWGLCRAWMWQFDQ